MKQFKGLNITDLQLISWFYNNKREIELENSKKYCFVFSEPMCLLLKINTKRKKKKC